MVKKTRQKELILRVLMSNPFHPTAVSIYDQVRKEMPHISLATVYRNLKLFLELDMISELDVDGSLSRFDIRTDEHGHFWCKQCDRIFNLDEPVNKTLNGGLARKNGFEVSNYQLVMRGLCPECRTSHKDEANTKNDAR
ncbi:MAG: hypothetical protein A2Z28_04630 [Chloroflexi bacterium RBG_16_51_9]|nr:MAG: hypothetical protein A2Z28_04630 [Chloroflexi bacterium RBG_16_51_9]